MFTDHSFNPDFLTATIGICAQSLPHVALRKGFDAWGPRWTQYDPVPVVPPVVPPVIEAQAGTKQTRRAGQRFKGHDLGAKNYYLSGHIRIHKGDYMHLHV